jgi:hypothetical protein
MVRINRKALRLRPDFADGGSEEGLSLPQQLLARDHVAVPQHQTALVTMQEIMDDFMCNDIALVRIR